MSRKITKNEMIERMTQKHNGYYNYSLVEYINTKTKIKIICPKCGPFMQTPEMHSSGQGCPKCRVERTQQTNMKRYGVPNVTQSKERNDKAKQTLLERYGI